MTHQDLQLSNQELAAMLRREAQRLIAYSTELERLLAFAEDERQPEQWRLQAAFTARCLMSEEGDLVCGDYGWVAPEDRL